MRHSCQPQGGDDKVKAPVKKPGVTGNQQNQVQNTENLVVPGKRKRSVSQDDHIGSDLLHTFQLDNCTPVASQQADLHLKSNILSQSYVPCLPNTQNGPTPPLSPHVIPDTKSFMEESPASSDALPASKLHSLARTLKMQIGLEILFKHDELRLIDQELAKCQIAYEQLRRCTEIPYPASSFLPEANTAAGSFSRNLSDRFQPRSPAPLGVTDGPYSRHYAKWLLPDPTFDGGEMNFVAAQHSEFARSTRGKPIESVMTPGKRGNISKAPLIPLVPKDKSGPMIVRRKSDGKMVKLRCLDCLREDFGSAQGFINHCRIQHTRLFSSHDAAAAACGVAVDGAVVGAPSTPITSTPVNGSVHPLIRSAHLIKPSQESVDSMDGQLADDKQVYAQGAEATPQVSPVDAVPPSPAHFRASTQTPNLSALIRAKGLGINVQDLVTDAKRKDPVPELDDCASDFDIDTPPTDPFGGHHPQIAGTKQPAGASFPQQGGKTSSFGQVRIGGRVTYPSMRTDLFSQESSDLELEPSPTNESNQAPSLVDDDEDDDYEAHSPTSSSESGDDAGDVNFHIEDEEVGGPSNLSPLYPDPSKQQIESIERRPSAFRRRLSSSREEKHVSFVSPSPAREMSKHDSKRRKL